MSVQLGRKKINTLSLDSSSRATSIKTLGLDELDAVSGGDLTLQEAGGVLMAVGASGAGVGVVTGQPQIVAGSAVIGALGGGLYLIGEAWVVNS
ncbi:Blp family class II bacteriocin [Erythrobacter sp. SCSIO 43205]|uniref:Blp family class II bacteriocin n=1 Tax=Erythrobacter sp. SCSIO 43205 TaxID=2779361 RepID=UPI001CA8012F|nr:Blp family class II bacteriocin [Erythrobacter sp. SCSIO 43205]UAB78340.1 Blp family class II bacteriocin [Erythrobacter sp. SCSIO 43205]